MDKIRAGHRGPFGARCMGCHLDGTPLWIRYGKRLSIVFSRKGLMIYVLLLGHHWTLFRWWPGVKKEKGRR